MKGITLGGLCLLQLDPGHNGHKQQDGQTGRQPVAGGLGEQGGEQESHYRSQPTGDDEGGRSDVALDHRGDDDSQSRRQSYDQLADPQPAGALHPELMKAAQEPKVTGRTVISSELDPPRLLASTRQTTGRLSKMVQETSPAAAVESWVPFRRTLTDTAPVTCQEAVVSCPTASLAG